MVVNEEPLPSVRTDRKCPMLAPHVVGSVCCCHYVYWWMKAEVKSLGSRVTLPVQMYKFCDAGTGICA